MVVADIRKSFTNAGRDPRMSFYRTEKGFEIDVILEVGGKIMPVEIKSSMTYGRSLIRNLEEFCSAVSSTENPVLVYDGSGMEGLGHHGVVARNWREGLPASIRLS